MMIFDCLSHRAILPRLFRELLVCGLFAITPCMFLWASVQAWRFITSGIASICSGYLLFGFMGSFVSIYNLIFGRAWGNAVEDAISAGISVLMLALGVVVAPLPRRGMIAFGCGPRAARRSGAGPGLRNFRPFAAAEGNTVKLCSARWKTNKMWDLFI